MLRDASSRKFDVVVVDELSRLTRADPFDAIRHVFGPLRDAHVAIDSLAEGKFQNVKELVQLFLAVLHCDKGHKESVTLSRHVATGYKNRLLAEGGRPILQIGKPLFGYKRVWDTSRDGKRVGGPRLLLEEEQAQVVRSIFDSYVNRDLSLADICRQLEARSILSLAQTDQPCNRAAIEAVIAEMEILLDEFEQARLDNDVHALRAVLRHLIAWVEVRTQPEQAGGGKPGKNGQRYSYKLQGGRVVLKPAGMLTPPMPKVAEAETDAPIILGQEGNSKSYLFTPARWTG